MTARRAAWIGGGAALLCCLAQVLAAVLLYQSAKGWDYLSLLLLGFPIVGAVIVSQQPRNTIGWLLVVCGTSISLGFLCGAIVYYTLDSDPALWQEILAWVTNIIFVAGVEGLLLSLAFLFPTGRTMTPRWRTAGRAVAVVMVLNFGIVAVRPGPQDNYFEDAPQLTNPFGIPGVDTVVDFLTPLFVPIAIGVVLTTLAAVVVRVRRARGIERLQLQWLALAFGLVGVSLTLIALSSVLLPNDDGAVIAVFEPIFFIAGTLGVAAAIGIAILRYHLYDIERILNRTIVYLALSASLVLVYVALTLLLGGAMRSLTGVSGSVVTAGATLISAALFSPLRTRIQRLVDRRFYRRKYDAARLIDAFSMRARDEVDLVALQAELQAILVQTMQPAHVSVWLRPIAQPERT